MCRNDIIQILDMLRAEYDCNKLTDKNS